MELNERKEKILDAVIRNYLETGEPVGSRTISKYTDLKTEFRNHPKRNVGSGGDGIYPAAPYIGGTDPIR